MSNVMTITLGESSFNIPELPLGVQRKIWPIEARMRKRARAAREISKEALSEAMESKENIEDALELIFLGIQFGKPQFQREELDALAGISLPEILESSTTISIQAGGKVVGERIAAALAAVQAAKNLPPISSQNGTGSLLESASAPAGNPSMSSGS